MSRPRPLVVTGARILTPDPIEASAIAITDGEIAGIGAPSEMRDLAGPDAEVIEADGATLTPGLIDSHAHPFHATTLARGIDLGPVRSWDGLCAALRAEAERIRAHEPEGTWLRAWNLDYAVFAGRIVAGSQIDEAVLGLPAVVMFFDCHTAVATVAALRVGGITGAEAFADAATVVVDSDGRPTGELREPSAYNRLLDRAPALGERAKRDAVVRTLAAFNRSGITGAVLMDGFRDTLDLYEEIDATGDGLSVRLVSALQHQQSYDEEAVEDIIAQRDRRGRRWRGGLIKLFHDGVIDTGTAWLYEPDRYGDGLAPLWPDPAKYEEVARRYAEAGFQLATHAIGDRAVGEVVGVYERIGARAASGAPHRIEHLETMTDEDLGRIARAGIGVSMQPLHMQWRAPDHSDSWADRLGEARSARGWRAKDVLRSGVGLALGSDWPVAQHDARIGMAWARLRRHSDEREGHVYEPGQRLTGEEALRAYTSSAADMLGDPAAGRIVPGAKGDLALWADDPTRVPPEELPDLPVLATIVDGRVVHRSES